MSAACLEFLRGRSRPVGRSAVPPCRSSLLSSVVVGVSSSSCHRCPLLAPCPSSRFAVPVRRRLCSRFVPCGCRAACRIMLGGAGGGVFVSRGALRACLACGAVSPSSPFYSTRRAGRYCFGVSAACGRSHRLLIGGVRFCFDCPFYPYRRAAVSAMWRSRDGAGVAVCPLACLGGAWFRPSFLSVVSSLLRLIPLSCFSLFLFPFRPTPSCGFSLACWFQLVPRPRAWEERTKWSICGCGRDGDLLASYRVVSLSRLRSFAFVLPAARVFISCLVFLACLVGSRLPPPGPVRSRPVRFLLRACFRPRLIRRVRLACRPLPARPLIGDSVAVPCHPIGAVPCFSRRCRISASCPLRLVLSARFVSCLVPPCLVVPRPGRRSACFAHLGLVRSCSRVAFVSVLPLRLSCGLTPFRPSPRIACRRTGRLAVPWSPIVLGGSLLGGVPRGSLVPRWLVVVVSPRVRPVILACLSRLGSCVDGVGVSCCLPLIRISPRRSYRVAGRFFPFRLFFPALAYSSIMA